MRTELERRLIDRLGREGLRRREFVLIGYAMAEHGMDYREALEAYADYTDDAPERVHADLCYRLLRRGKEEEPEAFLARIVKGVRE